jgi:single-strand DNA-binding protein
VSQNTNVVIITGNLTHDPTLRETGGGTSVCAMRVAVNSRRKNSTTGEWEDKPNYFDVTVFGGHGESCRKYLAKGRPVAIEGRLDWREWEAKDGSGKRQAVQIIANNVEFLGKKPEEDETPDGTDGATDSPGEDRQLAGVGAGADGDDDIPF